ncbi:mitochondrial inner membrane protein OXA1-like isoform X2 [Prunus yedoensis var. nudiflora]|uniref:Mitochondrial inner membrane protein OXA1-like isoform X2 n=1 Tax=Prunus yedoensis var. nudiflora TaxID=2094558 RepID=A0A314XW36_PRUYE|nr:mitochondrial inner membrane protein OXA1-like isoform X2 [Prunus yedoensis var. nudiflora]
MACRRSVSTTVTFGTRRFHPSFSHILHDNNEDAKSHAPNSSSPPPVIKSTLPSGSYNSTVRFCFGSRCRERTGSSLAWKMGLGSFHCRYMSTVIDDGSDKINDVGYFAEVITDKTVEVVTSQAPAVSEVAAAAADSFFPVAALQYLIDGVHFLYWMWASIALTTILIRGATIPLLINQLRATTQLSLMRPHLEELKQQMQDMAMDPNVLQEGQKRMKALFKEYGVNPLSQLQPLFIQGPIFISFFLAVRNMAEKVPSFQSGGALWFTDLTTPDSLLILPVLTSLTFLITVECNMQEGLEGNPIAQTMKNYSRILAAISVPVMMSFPKALFCYWLTSNLFSLTYGLVIRRPEVKSFLGLPEIPVPPPAPSQPQSFLSSAIEQDTTLNQDLRYPSSHQRLLTEEYHGLQFSSRDLKVWKIKSRKEINKRRCERTAPTMFMVHRMMESFLLDGYKSVSSGIPFGRRHSEGRVNYDLFLSVLTLSLVLCILSLDAVEYNYSTISHRVNRT